MVWATIPSVVPAARRISWDEVRLPRFTASVWVTAMNSNPVRMSTTLLSTGVHIGGAKLPRTLRMAPTSAPIP